MIGAGIFLLAGVALELTGPAAIMSYILAGAICLMTAASAAELATGMPTSGGDYYFVSRALGPAFGAISGVGIWLSLTVAIAFYLIGMGEFLTQIAPIEPLVGAIIGGVLLTILNVVGAKESGRTQVAVVVTLVLILAVFVVGGAFEIETDNFTPFFPFGGSPVLSTTALVFVSFLGFVKIAAVAEEVEDPDRNLPRTLMGSVAIVTVLYILIVLTIGGLFTQTTIVGVNDPLTQAARTLFGSVGGQAIIFAGLLATLSSANASIMASSRINLAMSRDRMFPRWLAQISERFVTPARAITLTSVLALVAMIAIPNIEELAKVASSLQLYSYAALNIGCVVLRAADPHWYRPTFRTPGYPFTQLVAAGGCLSIILFSGPFAQIAVGTLIVLSLAFYAVWGRQRADIEHAVPDLRSRWARLGLRAFFTPAVRFGPEGKADEERPAPPIERITGPGVPRRVVVALANPETEASLLGLGRALATGADAGGEVLGVHLERVPRQTSLSAALESLTEEGEAERALERLPPITGDVDVPIRETSVDVITDVVHDVFDGLLGVTHGRQADLLVMGWQGGFTVGRIYNSPLQRIMAGLEADLAVLKDRGTGRFRRVLVPWGGGVHAKLGVELAVRAARADGGEVEVLRVVHEDVDPEAERERLRRDVTGLIGPADDVTYRVRQAGEVSIGIGRTLEEDGPFDLVVIGASRESRLRNVLFGSIPDIVADEADCSVLMVRRYIPTHWTFRLSGQVKRLREAIGSSSSPEEARTRSDAG
ncbi:MAG: amino acid permease [Actinobacteria bacterium]|nr:amino acid permease [Actinomycetota bacterium]